jgi:hypothetical protein
MFSVRTTGRRRRWVLGLLAAGATAGGVAACATLTGKSPSGAATFETPQAAVDTLVAAARAENEAELRRVLGPDSTELLSSGDDVADANGRAEFLRLYDEKHKLESTSEDSVTLDVGATDWPLPIPIVKGEQGWYFDTKAGLDEMLSRRIGKNELATIQVCLAIVDAQREYAAADFSGSGWLEYAQKLRSSPGKKDGLYWETKEGEPQSPMGDLVAEATAEGYALKGDADAPRPYHGYYYKLLTAQGPAAPGGSINYLAQGHLIGGFAVVAWPADYGNSGLKTFISSHHGDVYEKDLGENTESVVRAMKEFNPDGTWEKSDTEP